MSESPKDWSNYHEVKEKEPVPGVIEQVVEKLVLNKDKALELGSSSLRDTKYLLDAGFNSVTAVDGDPNTTQFAEALQNERLIHIVSKFESFEFPEDEYDFVLSFNALSFIHRDNFDNVMSKVKKSIAENGIFLGNFFGVNDSWAKNPRNTFVTKEEIEVLFKDCELYKIKEFDEDGVDAHGKEKHWHTFTVIARKPAQA